MVWIAKTSLQFPQKFHNLLSKVHAQPQLLHIVITVSQSIFFFLDYVLTTQKLIQQLGKYEHSNQQMPNFHHAVYIYQRWALILIALRRLVFNKINFLLLQAHLYQRYFGPQTTVKSKYCNRVTQIFGFPVHIKLYLYYTVIYSKYNNIMFKKQCNTLT